MKRCVAVDLVCWRVQSRNIDDGLFHRVKSQVAEAGGSLSSLSGHHHHMDILTNSFHFMQIAYDSCDSLSTLLSYFDLRCAVSFALVRRGSLSQVSWGARLCFIQSQSWYHWLPFSWT